jgi:hypothetical protein
MMVSMIRASRWCYAQLLVLQIPRLQLVCDNLLLMSRTWRLVPRIMSISADLAWLAGVAVVCSRFLGLLIVQPCSCSARLLMGLSAAADDSRRMPPGADE